jgi:hypothetical protein
MRSIVRLTLTWVLLVIPTLADAQPRDTFMIWNNYSRLVQAPASLMEISDTGLLLRTITKLPTSFNVQTVATGGDNQSWLINGYFQILPNYPWTFLEVRHDGSMKTIHTGPPLSGVNGMVRNCDGDWIVVNNRFVTKPVPLEIWRLRGNTLTSLSQTPGAMAIWGNPIIDEETGQVLLRAITNYAPVKAGYFRIDPYTGTMTDYHVIPQSNQLFMQNGAREAVFNWPDDSWVEVYGDVTLFAQMVRLRRGQPTSWFSRCWWGKQPASLVRAGQRTSGVAYYVLNHSSSYPPGSGRYWDITGIEPDGTWLKTHYLRGVPMMAWTGLTRFGDRHLSWHMDRLPNGRSLHLSFPGEGGRAYLVGLTLKGFRPGTPLPDGRVVPLMPDDLTLLCLQGGITGVLENTVGRLNASGRAVVRIDTNGFGAALKGQKLWASALVLDPAASHGVAYIVGPTVLDIRQ